MIAQYLDLTTDFANNASVVFDMGGWDYAVAQFVAPSGTINITASNDDGSVTGSLSGNATTATNFQTVQATKLADGTAVTAVAAAGLYKLNTVGRFVKFGGAAATATKLIVMLAKIS